VTEAGTTPQHAQTQSGPPGDGRDRQTRDDGLPPTSDQPPSQFGTDWYKDNWPVEDLHADWHGTDPGDQRTEEVPLISGGVTGWGPTANTAVDGSPGQLLPAQSAAQHLTCPECGTPAMVTVTRRESTDFCRKCDYPLFWVPSRIELDRSAETAEQSLRRLPGTAGRATVASVACPHCAEPNTVIAQTCVRCGLSMTVTTPPPPPPRPVYRAPEPEPVAEIDRSKTPWWIWALLFGTVAILVALVAYGLVRRYG
jgi:predicted RNA-binding Zn-ribbon protein involved in translation (DUF1610 family)